MVLLNDPDGLCQRLLISGDTDITSGLSSTSSLHLAARNGHTAVVRFAHFVIVDHTTGIQKVTEPNLFK